MDSKTKREVMAKSRLMHGLLNVLEFNLDSVRMDVSDNEVDSLKKSIEDSITTLYKLEDVLIELTRVLGI